MKKFSVLLIFCALMLLRASAQITVALDLSQNQFLPGEAIIVAVKITNESGQRVHLGAESNWLTFSIESADGFIVNKISEVPVAGEFDLESSQMGIKRVDLQPYFGIVHPGRYKIIATLRVKAWNLTISSPPKNFDLINGVELWAQTFGVPATNSAPELRRYAVEEANYVHGQLMAYARVTDATESKIFKVTALGPLVSFNQPDEQVDRNSQLHVLWQTGAQAFSYVIVNSDGLIVRRDIYDQVNTRPRLAVQDNGNVVVVGGVKRPEVSAKP